MKPLDRINGQAAVARRYGLEEAVFLDYLMFWYKENRANQRNFRDGRWWTYNSVNALSQIFPWWSVKQLRRIAESCRTKGAILAGNYSADHRDRTLWYTPSDELLALYGTCGEGSCVCPNGNGLRISRKSAGKRKSPCIPRGPPQSCCINWTSCPTGTVQ